jgi:serine/threonine protein kinase
MLGPQGCTTHETQNSPQDATLGRLIEELTCKLQTGQPVDLNAYLDAYPEHAEELAQMFGAVKRLAELGVAEAEAQVEHSGGVAMPQESPGRPSLGELGDFRLLREVGRGGMGIVYEAEQASLRRKVALKVLPLAAALDSKQLRRFQIEAQAAACLHHTHIVPVHAVGCERGVHYYAMQFIAGHSLAELIKELRRLEGLEPAHKPTPEFVNKRSPTEAGGDGCRAECGSAPPGGREPAPAATAPGFGTVSASSSSFRNREYIRRVAELGVQVAEALDHAHSRGILHRDIKPGNLLLDELGQLWVADFGLAQIQDNPCLTLTGDILGTLRYMSPESAAGGKLAVVDSRTDIYSLGVTLYELLTLRPAVDGGDRPEILRKIAEEEPAHARKHNAAVPRDLETILLKAAAKEPGSRYATAKDLADDLRRFLEDKPVLARRPGLLDRAAKWSRRHRAVVATGFVGLLAAGAILAGSIGWIVRDRAARLAMTEREVIRALDEAAAHQAESKWPEALEAVKRAEGILAAGGTRELPRRVRELREDLEMVLRLEEIRMLAVAPEAPTDGLGQAFDYGGTDLEYAKAFREYGIDIAALAPQDAARSIVRRGIRQELVDALDNWACCRAIGRRKGNVQQLIAVACAADPDELRNRLRDLFHRPRAEWETLLNQLPVAVKDRPLSASSLDVCGFILCSIGKSEQALAVFEEAQRRYPGDFWLNFHLGFCHSRLQTRLDGAIRFYSVARGLRPDCVFLLDHLGNALRAVGRQDEAMHCFREAIRLNPNYASGHFGLGNLLMAKGELHEAIACYRRVLRLKPSYVAAQYQIGYAMERSGSSDEAMREYKAAIRLDPNFGEAHIGLGRLRRDKGLLQPPSQQVREQWRREMERRAGALKVSRIEKKQPMAVEMVSKPLLRYNEAPRETDEATLWAWGRSGRPVMLVAMEFSPLDEGWATGFYEMVCLADGPISVEGSAGRWHWLPQEPTVTIMREFGAAPVPADSEPDRLAQMKELVKRMAAHADAGRVELRVLPEPIHRYADHAAGLLDGAIFAFTSGDNPEIVLLIEAGCRGEVAPRWRYGLARLSGASLSVTLDGGAVWKQEQSDGLNPQEGYWIAGEPYPPH